MSLSSWFSLKKHDDFANNLVTEFVDKCPPSIIDNLHEKKSRIKYDKAINRLNMQAGYYTSNTKLNIYTKARIGNKFMWGLKESGYDEELIETLTNGLLHALSKK